MDLSPINWIKIKFRKLFLKNYILKVFTFNGFSSIIRVLSNFILVKVIATFLGPGGLAIFGQLGSLTSIVNISATGGISNAIIKYTSENIGKYNILFRYWFGAFVISITLVLLNTLLLIVFSEEISNIIFNDKSLFWVIVVLGLSSFFFVFSNFIISVLNGFNKLIEIIYINVINTVIVSIYCIFFTIIFGLEGALFALASSQLIQFFLVIKYFKKKHFLIIRRYFRGINLSSLFKDYGAFSIMAIASAIFVPMTYLVIRNIIITKLSINDAGVYEGMLKLSNAYLGIISTTITFYYLPKFSSMNSYLLINKEIRNLFKILIPGIILFLLMFFISKNFIIRLVLSNEFLKISDFIIWQLIGDVFRSMSFVFSILFISKKYVVKYIILEFMFGFIFVILSYFFINSKGLNSISMAYMISCIVVFSMFLIFHLRNSKTTIFQLR